MPRGRSKNLIIPQTRGLVLQREYRARKARYVADLETRCRKAEGENERLREELALARSQSLGPRNPPYHLPALQELMMALKSASTQLAQFQAVAFPGQREAHHPRSPSPSSDQCCGGLIDCRGLVEEYELEQRPLPVQSGSRFEES
ncbi:basic region leucin zipper protein [Mycena floridula]|nr:basic region leucin zipper protein [Mycena floridula]